MAKLSSPGGVLVSVGEFALRLYARTRDLDSYNQPTRLQCDHLAALLAADDGDSDFKTIRLDHYLSDGKAINWFTDQFADWHLFNSHATLGSLGWRRVAGAAKFAGFNGGHHIDHLSVYDGHPVNYAAARTLSELYYWHEIDSKPEDIAMLPPEILGAATVNGIPSVVLAAVRQMQNHLGAIRPLLGPLRKVADRLGDQQTVRMLDSVSLDLKILEDVFSQRVSRPVVIVRETLAKIKLDLEAVAARAGGRGYVAAQVKFHGERIRASSFAERLAKKGGAALRFFNDNKLLPIFLNNLPRILAAARGAGAASANGSTRVAKAAGRSWLPLALLLAVVSAIAAFVWHRNRE